MSLARVSFGKYFATGSVSDSFFSSARIISAEQVNCFVTEPMANIVRGVTASPAASVLHAVAFRENDLAARA